jgi:hypothetical protein
MAQTASHQTFHGWNASHHTYHSPDNTIKLPIIAAATHSLKIPKPENQTSPLHFHTHT